MIDAMMSQHDKDWCHLCGQRRNPTADIWYANNAENDKVMGTGHYIRICSLCGDRIARVARGTEIGDPQLTKAKKPKKPTKTKKSAVKTPKEVP